MFDRRFLIVGCGSHAHTALEEITKSGKAHEALHPVNLFDTLDIDSSVKPTYLKDINTTNDILSMPKEKYALVVYERFPAKAFSKNAALSAAHLLDKNGMVAMLPTGERIMLFKQLVSYMKEAGFQTAVVSPLVNLVFFFKCDNRDNKAINILKKFIGDVEYINQLFKDDGLLASFKNAPQLTVNNLIEYVWATEDLCKKYDELRSLSAVQQWLGAAQLGNMLRIKSTYENSCVTSSVDFGHDNVKNIASVSIFANSNTSVVPKEDKPINPVVDQKQPPGSLADPGVWHWLADAGVWHWFK